MERMHRHIPLHSSSEENEFFSLKMSVMLPLPACISKVFCDQQGGILKGSRGEHRKSFCLILQRRGIVQREEDHG